MIAVIVQYKLQESMTRERLEQEYEKAVPRFQGMDGLICKYFLYKDDGTGGGVYIWESREKADACYTKEMLDSLEQRMGYRPVLSYFDLPFVVDNSRNEVIRQTVAVPAE